MTQLEFISGMKKLSGFYFKEITDDQIILWYDLFKDISFSIFLQAITDVSKESKFMPNTGILYEKCLSAKKEYLFDLLKFMYDDGYFHESYKKSEKLSDDHAEDNYNKAINWIDNDCTPLFLKNDINKYAIRYKKLNLDNSERLLKC